MITFSVGDWHTYVTYINYLICPPPSIFHSFLFFLGSYSFINKFIIPHKVTYHIYKLKTTLIGQRTCKPCKLIVLSQGTLLDTFSTEI